MFRFNHGGVFSVSHWHFHHATWPSPFAWPYRIALLAILVVLLAPARFGPRSGEEAGEPASRFSAPADADPFWLGYRVDPGQIG